MILTVIKNNHFRNFNFRNLQRHLTFFTFFVANFATDFHVKR